MILFDGKLLADEETDRVIAELWDKCIRTISGRTDIAEMVIDACGCLSAKIKKGEYDAVLKPLLLKGVFSKEQVEEAVNFFDRDNLRYKYDIELGILKDNINDRTDVPDKKDSQSMEAGIRLVRKIQPLGILFHIAAGNAEGLPFYSVIEGMLAGNINILKLPSVDDGLSVMLLKELVQIQPKLAPYVCVLDVPSTNLRVMKELADMADGIVVWGGDEAVRAVRNLASPETQIISWGHKLSFAYIEADADETELEKLAEHICETRQLLCNSCQGIFVDTEDENVVRHAGERFLHILEKTSKNYPKESIGIRGKISLSLYNEEIETENASGTEAGSKEMEQKNSGPRKWILRGDGVSVIVSTDNNLELSYMFKNCWVKPLPRKDIVKALKGKKGHLQTVGLICGKDVREELAEELVKAGVTRVAFGGDMSHAVLGAAHDGEYPLRRYSRIVEIEMQAQKRQKERKNDGTNESV